jgi:hypothetical protein
LEVFAVLHFSLGFGSFFQAVHVLSGVSQNWQSGGLALSSHGFLSSFDYATRHFYLLLSFILGLVSYVDSLVILVVPGLNYPAVARFLLASFIHTTKSILLPRSISLVCGWKLSLF